MTFKENINEALHEMQQGLKSGVEKVGNAADSTKDAICNTYEKAADAIEKDGKDEKKDTA